MYLPIVWQIQMIQVVISIQIFDLLQKRVPLNEIDM